jgi:hypothetical protein
MFSELTDDELMELEEKTFAWAERSIEVHGLHHPLSLELRPLWWDVADALDARDPYV